MLLPEELQITLEELLCQVSLPTLQVAAQRISNNYRERRFAPLSEIERLAYVATRMPATYQAITRVLSELKRRAPSLRVESIVDFGAGPGTAYWAAADHFPSLHLATLLEKDAGFIALGKKLLERQEVVWQQRDLSREGSIPTHDLAIASYSLGEMGNATSVVEQMWSACRKALVILEPGTPAGFETIRRVREQLILLGAHILAPCPHAATCPMEKSDWCHFSVRLQRTFHHRFAKEASMGYEDEKFSYLIAARTPAEISANSRVLRHPLQQKGCIHFTLCTPEGIKKTTLTRKNKELFRRAKKTNWGDSLS